ncbi:MAG: LacI family DNA-binding transcriptional regulator [Balneolaceae bacterium]|nr:LacI family DNA-binding transcriptional regulator [Balneolaceae bacterium]
MPKTIYDIANAAGVSIATVSRVFNSSNSVKETTREKILKIADEMGYHPQAYAQGLASKKKNSIMLLVPVMSNYFFTEILRGTQDILTDENIELTILNINQEKGVFRQVEQVIKRQWADGYLLVSLHLSQQELQKLKRYKVPISLLDDHSTHFDSVSFNNEQGGYTATKYLLNKGHKQIVLLSGRKESIPNKERLKGYLKALGEYKIPFDENLHITGDSMDRDGFTEKNGYEAMSKILKLEKPVDAIFCTSDIKAVGALKAMDDFGKKIPLISYDNLSISEYIGLSTIFQPMYKMGCQATRHLLNRIDNPEMIICDHIHNPELIIRKSSEF